MKNIASYGSWLSPISSDSVVQDSVQFYEMQGGEDGLYWLEFSPKGKGRFSLIRYDGKETSLLPEISVRTRVHEYGGGAFFVDAENVIYSNDSDRQLYDLTGRQLTYAENWRFADGCGFIWVAEKHDGSVENCLVSIENKKLRVIASGHDFYSSPRLSPNKKQLAFITWDFPKMQWDSSTLWLADRGEDGNIYNLRPIAGGNEVSVCNIQWSPQGVLHYVSDERGFLNLYRFDGARGKNLCEMEAEFASPPWVFGMSSYAFLDDGFLICAFTQKGKDFLGRLDPKTGKLKKLEIPFTAITNVVAWNRKIYFFGGSPTTFSSIVCYDPQEESCKIVKESCRNILSKEQISISESIFFKTTDGHLGHAFYYPPKNSSFQDTSGRPPPLLVKAHGGPTSRSSNQLSLTVQYWTSRGYAFLDVNYGGSTGFGRSYMKRLEGNWGVIDVDDIVQATKVLVDRGFADKDRLLIHGGSAGGYTALTALAFYDIFVAGTSLYGVSDIEMLCKDTHKFEKKYIDILVAPYPDSIDLIRQRSPITHVNKMSRPILLLQGEEDTIVPPKQSIVIFEALKKKRIPTGILLFKGEGHGFKRAENIKKSLDAQLFFYSEVLGMELPEPFDEPPVDIVR